jgi:hypothetical protein
VVDAYFKQIRSTVDSIYLNNLHYHLMMGSRRLNKSRPVHVSRLRTLKVSDLTESEVEAEFKHTTKLFDTAGTEDKIAKDAAFTATLQTKALVKTTSLKGPAKPAPKKKAARKAAKKK